jgi:hypothetical protein
MGRHRGPRMRRTRLIRAAVLVAALFPASILAGCGRREIVLRGAVIQQNADPHKQSPIPGVDITATSGTSTSTARSDASGYFSIKLLRWIRWGQTVTLTFRHADYQPLELTGPVSHEIYIARMVPLARKVESPSRQPKTAIGNIKIRYSMKSNSEVNIGSAVKTFEVVNKGNIPCNNQQPCSPDGKWKAAIASTSLDAGHGNEFRNARLSCIGGPCPFTEILSDGYSGGGDKLHASVLNWSDTTTFLLEAEVYHPMQSELVRESYPVIFGRALNFSLPATAEGPSIQADVNGTSIVFPLGPALCLTWADCTVTTDRDQSKTYRCQLKPGFEFH